MSEHIRAAAVGYALVDEKVIGGNALPPADYVAAEDYLHFRGDAYRTAGGSVANTMMALGAHAGHAARLYYTVSDDSRGYAFRDQTQPMLGPGTIRSEGYTGLCLIQLDASGEIADEITLYGVSHDIKVPREERKSRDNGLVLTNFNTIRNPHSLELVDDLVRRTLVAGGLFALRLSGAHESMVSHDAAQDVLAQLPYDPDILFTNNAELRNLIGSKDVGLESVFPNTRLVVVTNGAESAKLRLDGIISEMPIPEVDQVVDVTGAGDQLMGAMLAQLMNEKFADWDDQHVTQAALYGIAAASKIIRLHRSRFHNFRMAA